MKNSEEVVSDIKNKLNDFYSSPEGRALVEKTPEIQKISC